MTVPKLAQLADALAGRYEVEREIGAGGMATVYVARDGRHHRKVALKVLNPELAAVLGPERFLAEIEVTANLQHPHLLPLFDSGEANGLLFYVMPFVEGESLRARLEREKQLPVNEAVRIAVAVANALEYAHGHGVIHRDLKPENILLQAGQPVIADFGIALAVSKAGGARVTQTGISLGTPQYMSPEQATGDRAIDGRTDIYSLGAVLYEMLTGDAPHVASTAQAIIAKVLTERAPSVRTARPAVPTHVALSIEKALAKLPADRWSTAREFVDALEKRTPVDPTVSAELPTASAGRGRRVPMRWLASPSVWIPVALVGVGAASWALGRWSVVTNDAVLRASLAIPSDAFLASVLFVGPPIDISPDGRTVTYTAQSVAGPQIAIRRLDEFRVTILPNTVGGVYPVFSADGQSVVFFSGGNYKRIAVDGGPASLVSPPALSTGSGASVAPDGTVIIGNPTSLLHGLGTVSSPRDSVRPLTVPDTARGQFFHVFPRLLPDGETILFASRGRTGASDARIGIA
jgi:serine/threonine-protein kinase